MRVCLTRVASCGSNTPCLSSGFRGLNRFIIVNMGEGGEPCCVLAGSKHGQIRYVLNRLGPLFLAVNDDDDQQHRLRPFFAPQLVQGTQHPSLSTRPPLRQPHPRPDRGTVPKTRLSPADRADRHRQSVSLVPHIHSARPAHSLSHRNYLLAQAHVDAPALASSIAHLNTSTTFSPLQPLQDTDVAGYLRHAHEQNLISTIEEGRRETQEAFYRLLEDRSRKDWEAKKRRVFEELGGRSSSDSKALAEMKKSFHAKGSLSVRDTLVCLSPLKSLVDRQARVQA